MPVSFFVDSISGYPLPVLFVRGWCTDPSHVDVILECADGTLCQPTLLCREPRDDVRAAGQAAFPLPGFIAEFHLTGTPRSVIAYGKNHPVEHAERYSTAEPHYRILMDTDRILHREDIYGSGPPLPAGPLITELAATLPGPKILDFGCGSGDLVGKLRARGRDAVGVEIDRPMIREHMTAEVAPFVTLYGGGLPLPFGDLAFDSAIATEVIEHVDDPHAVVRELIRVCKTAILVTVPDMSSVPYSWPTNTVPWHLLESTHVNFFTAKSLIALFAPAFTPAQCFRINNYVLGEHFVPGNIGVEFRRAT